MVGLSTTQVIMGVILTVLGFITFYLVPQAFIQEDLSLFFLIFNGILIMIIFGMTFLSVMAFPFLERGLLYLTLNTCCRRDRHLHSMIQKNIDSHRKRNIKTSIMVTLTFAFSIFGTAMFKEMKIVLTKSIESIAGADIFVLSLDTPSLTFLD